MTRMNRRGLRHRRSGRAGWLALTLALAGCSGGEPATPRAVAKAPTKAPEAGPKAPEGTTTPSSERRNPPPPVEQTPEPVPESAELAHKAETRAAVPVCDQAVPAIARLRELTAETSSEERAAAVGDEKLLELLAHTDAATGRADKAALTSASPETPAGELATRAIDPALAFWMRDSLARAADVKLTAEQRAEHWSAANCAWEQVRVADALVLGTRARGPEGAALPVQEFDKTHLPDVGELVAAAFAAGRAAFKAPDDRLELVVQPARQEIEKSFYRLAHRSVSAGARVGADEGEQRLALHAFALIEDRLKDKNTRGIARVKEALADPSRRPPAGELDVLRELNVAFAKRTRKYCSDAVNTKGRGLDELLASATEGATYVTLILPEMERQLAADGFVVDEHRDDWQSLRELIEEASEVEGGAPDSDELAKVSAELVRWNCAYQAKLGIRECTSTADEKAR